MANAADSLKGNKAVNSVLGSEQQACRSALKFAATSTDPALKASLAKLTTAGATDFKREYGPSFETDNPLLIFAGWLITVHRRRPGRPFWFSLLQRFIRR